MTDHSEVAAFPVEHASRIADRLRGRRVCVSGGAGFIGSHLVDALVGFDADVTVIDDLSNGREDHLSRVADRVRLIKASILDESALATSLDGTEIVFHQAALGSVPASVERPVEYMRVNAMGTLAVLDAARRSGVHRVVYAASSSAYGDQPESPKVESMQPDPLSPYAVSKLAGEHLVRTFAHCYGVDGISLRYFNIFGPRQRADSPYAAVIPRFVDALRSGEPPTIHGDGEQTRDFTHVRNAVWANLLAATNPEALDGAVVNIACGHGVSLLQLLEALRVAGTNAADAVPPTHTPPRVGDVMHSTASIDAATALIGYRPIVSLEEGLRDLLG